MELKYKKLCGYEGNAKSKLGYEAYSHIYVYGLTKDLKRLVEFIDENFIIYKDTIKWNEHEIHIWGNNEETEYIQITLNEEKLKQVGCDNFYTVLKKKLELDFINTNIYARTRTSHKARITHVTNHRVTTHRITTRKITSHRIIRKHK